MGGRFVSFAKTRKPAGDKWTRWPSVLRLSLNNISWEEMETGACFWRELVALVFFQTMNLFDREETFSFVTVSDRVRTGNKRKTDNTNF